MTTPSNSTISAVLGDLIDDLPLEERDVFRSRGPGSFDHRRACVVEYFKRFHYRKVGREATEWLLPEETLALAGGDCEDLSFLLATLLESSGISPYCLRVALGVVVVHGPRTRKMHDHAWVVYQNEAGAWEILDPFLFCWQGRATRPRRLRTRAASARGKRRKETSRGSARPPEPDVEYVPILVLNRDHLWSVRSHEGATDIELESYLKQRRSLGRFNPTFAASVHDGIFDEAIGNKLSWLDRRRLEWTSLAVDVNTLAYDPRDHFDFSYVPDGWQLVGKRMQSGSFGDLALALHAACDFYAHTVYAEFARSGGKVTLYDPADPFDASGITYDFTRYAPIEGTKRTPEQCAALWHGKIISGQWWRWYSTFPKDLRKRADFEDHRSLPDHDLIAVDKNSYPGPQHRYTESDYRDQFALRRDAAVRHVRALYAEWASAHA